MSETPLAIENLVTLSTKNRNGHQILFKSIRREDVAAISQLYRGSDSLPGTRCWGEAATGSRHSERSRLTSLHARNPNVP